MTLVGISFNWVALDSYKFLSSLIISVKVTYENGKATSDIICFSISSILGWFSKFFIAFNTGSWWGIILGGC